MHPLISQAKNYEYVTTKARAWELLRGLKDEVYALDFETTALFPHEGEIRLSSIAGYGQKFLLDHFYCGDFAEFADFIAKREWAVFQAPFEGRWIDYHSDPIWVTLYDVQNLRKAKLGGAPLSLAIMCQRDLDLTLDKTEQKGMWGLPVLTQQQKDYAMLDSVATFALWEHWNDEITDDQWRGAMVLNDAWRATAEMEDTTLYLDVDWHAPLLAWWTKKRDLAERYLRKWVSTDEIANLQSGKQISDFLKANLPEEVVRVWPQTPKTKVLNTERDTLKLFSFRLGYPLSRWLAALMLFKKYSKYISTYGQTLIDAQNRLGHIPSRFNLAQAATGRYSSSSYNLQNIPRNFRVRRSFCSPTYKILTAFIEKHGRLPSRGETIQLVKMVMADYKSIEIRVLAELSGDAQLLHDAIYGDTHARSAAQINGIDFDYFWSVLKGPASALQKRFKELRAKAKAFTFQLLYGAGYAALAIVLRCTDEEAMAAVQAWAKLYPKAYHYRQYIFEVMSRDGFIPVCDGRTIYVAKPDRTMPVAANYPVQGAAASVMCRAVYHVHKIVWESALQIRLAATVHDEILMMSNLEVAEDAERMLIEGMTQGWLDIFPGTNTENLLEHVIGDHWGEKP